MREKLIELVHNARMNALWHNAKEPSEYITDMLITSGVVPVVRCKDCKHWNEETGFCDEHSHFFNDGMCWDMFNADDFCSYGERKDNE